MTENQHATSSGTLGPHPRLILAAKAIHENDYPRQAWDALGPLRQEPYLRAASLVLQALGDEAGRWRGDSFVPFTYSPDAILSASTTDGAEPAFPPHGADDAPDESKGAVPNAAPAPTPPVHVVQGPGGFTETFNKRQVETLEKLGLIAYTHCTFALEDGSGRGVGPLHYFYGPAS